MPNETLARPKPAGSRWTREEAVAWLQELGARVGRTPTLSDVVPHHMDLVRLFGGISKAQAAAGYVPNGIGRPRLNGRAGR